MNWEKIRAELSELETVPVSQEENHAFKKDIGGKLQSFLQEQKRYRDQSEREARDKRFKEVG